MGVPEKGDVVRRSEKSGQISAKSTKNPLKIKKRGVDKPIEDAILNTDFPDRDIKCQEAAVIKQPEMKTRR